MLPGILQSVAAATCPIGVDISAAQHRLLQLRCRRGHITASAAAQVALPADPEADTRPGEETGASEHVARLKSAIASAGFSGRRCVVALPRSDVFLQSLRMPPLPDAEMEEAIGWEAAERFGVKRDELEVDFVRLGTVDRGGLSQPPIRAGGSTAGGDPSEARTEILVVGARKETLHQRLEPLAAAGLRPVAVDTGFLAIARFYSMMCRRESDRSQIRALLEVGGSGSCFMVLHGDQLALCKPIPIGGQHLTQSVAEHLAIDSDLACELRKKRILARVDQRARSADAANPVDRSTDRAIFEAVRSLLDQLIKEVGLCLRYYGVTFRGKPPDRLILAGCDAFEPNFGEMLSSACKLQTMMDDPLSSVAELLMSIRAVIGAAEPPHAWATAAGLSLRDVAISSAASTRAGRAAA